MTTAGHGNENKPPRNSENLQRVSSATRRPLNRERFEKYESSDADSVYSYSSSLLADEEGMENDDSFTSPFRTPLTYRSSPLSVHNFGQRDGRASTNRLTGAKLSTTLAVNKENCSRKPRASVMGLLDPDDLEREFNSRNSERDELLRTIKALTNKNQSFNEALRREELAKQHKISILQKVHETQMEIKSSLVRNLESIIDEQEARIFGLETHISGLKNTLPENKTLAGVVALREQIDWLTARLAEVSDEFSAAQSTKEEQEKELTEMRAQCAALQLASANDDSSSGCSSIDYERFVADNEKQMVEISKENDELRDEVAQCRQIMAQQKSEFAHLEIHLAETSLNADKAALAQSQKLFEFQHTNDFLQTEVARLRSELDKRRNEDTETKAAVEQNKGEVCKLREGLFAAERENATLRASLNDSQLSCKLTSDELGQANAKISQLNEKMVADSKDLLHYKKLSEQLQDTLSRLRRESTTFQQRHVELLLALDCFRKTLSTLRETQNELHQEALRLPSDFQQGLIEARQQICRHVSKSTAEIVTKYKREMALRKKYHNELVELRGNIRVFCRIRPFLATDVDQSVSPLEIDVDDDCVLNVKAANGRQQTFAMDKVFGQEDSQIDIFNEVEPLIVSCIDGYNVCIFAYGQTGSGKTFTMEGPSNDPGINKRALAILFEETAAKAPDWSYTISVSMLEVYNETIRDLLSDDATCKLDVKLNAEGSLHVPGLTSVQVVDVDQVNNIFGLGKSNRATASTNMNEHSSRSHALLCISVVGYNNVTKVKTSGKLNLVDLAGSERLSKSQAEGDRLKEAQAINKSLAALGDVICALRNKQQFVPFRNSKLTYLLQDSLAGESKTLMVAQVAPNANHVGETLCSLNFAQRVRSVELGPQSQKATLAPSNADINNGADAESPSLNRTPSKQYGLRGRK